MSDNIIDLNKYRAKHDSSNVPLRKWQRDIMEEDIEKEMAFATNSYVVGAANHGYSDESTDLIENSNNIQETVKKSSDILENDWIQILKSVEKTHDIKTKIPKILFTSTLVTLVFAGSNFVIKHDIIPFLNVPEYNVQTVENWLKILGSLPLSAMIGVGAIEKYDKYFNFNTKNNNQKMICDELTRYVNKHRIATFLMDSICKNKITENIDIAFCDEFIISIFGIDNYYLIRDDKNLYKKLCQTIQNASIDIYNVINEPLYGYRNYRGR